MGRAGDPGRGGETNFSNNRMNSLKPKRIDPIIQAAQIQADALTKGQELFNPYLQAGAGALPALQQGSTVEGLDDMIGQIFSSEGFGRLKDERMNTVRGELGASGLTRSGEGIEELANIPTDLAFSIEQLLNGRSSELVDMGRGSATSIAKLMSGSAEATASGILGLEERRINDKNNSRSNTNDLIKMGIMAFSDPRLKENIKKIGTKGPLDIVKWDWIENTKKTIVGNFPTTGFLSTQVREHFPEFVKEYGGFDVVNYEPLLERLNHATS